MLNSLRSAMWKNDIIVYQFVQHFNKKTSRKCTLVCIVLIKINKEYKYIAFSKHNVLIVNFFCTNSFSNANKYMFFFLCIFTSCTKYCPNDQHSACLQQSLLFDRKLVCCLNQDAYWLQTGFNPPLALWELIEISGQI